MTLHVVHSSVGYSLGREGRVPRAGLPPQVSPGHHIRGFMHPGALLLSTITITTTISITTTAVPTLSYYLPVLPAKKGDYLGKGVEEADINTFIDQVSQYTKQH